MEKAYKFRIYPTQTQKDLIESIFSCVRYVYNHFLAQRISLYKEDGASTTRFVQDKELTSLKQQKDWLRVPDKCALQNSLKALDSAYKNFFRGCKTGQRVGFPKFMSKKSSRQSYQTNCNIEVGAKAIKLPKLGLVTCKVSRIVEGRIVNATVSRNPAGKYFVSVCCIDVDVPQLPSTGAVVGLDMGLHDLVITSNGVKYANNKHLVTSKKKLARLQKLLSRKTKGSSNRNRARIKVARLQEHIANQRRDMLQKLTTELIRTYDVICIEDLCAKNMVTNHKLAKGVTDASWGEMARELKYKAAWHRKLLVKVDRFYPSSQICSCCGYQNKETKDLSVRWWDCPSCDAQHDRDINAAVNILHEGLKVAATVA